MCMVILYGFKLVSTTILPNHAWNPTAIIVNKLKKVKIGLFLRIVVNKSPKSIQIYHKLLQSICL